MNYLRVTAIAFILLSLLVWSPAAFAFEFYRWVDENGVTNFSQWRPAEPQPGITKEVLPDELPDNFPGGMKEDVYALSTHASEMRAVWEKLETQREDRLRRKVPDAQPVVLHSEPVQSYAVPIWYAPARKQPMKPRVEPETPIASVPFKQPGSD